MRPDPALRPSAALRQLFGLLLALILAAAAPFARAAISIVDDTSYTQPSNLSSIPLTVPATTQAGDLILVQIMADTNTTTVTAPAGWTAVTAPASAASGSFRHQLYYRVATGADAGASYSWTLGTSMRAAGGMIVLRGVDTVSPLIDAQAAQTGSGASIVAPTVAVSTANSLAVTFFAADIGGTTIVPNSPLTPAYSTASGAGPNGVAIAAAYALRSAAGNTPGYSATGPTAANLGHVLVFRPAVSCFSDTFSRTSLGTTDWAVSSRGPNAFTPSINTSNGRLRLTSSVTNQATAAALLKTFPAANNRVEIVFDYFGYNGTNPPADGIAVILSDASKTPQPGGYGGSLGYAPNGAITGFNGGWLGVGIDEFGNYSNPTEGRTLGPGSRPNAVAIRGSAPGYRYLTGTATLSPVLSTSTGHRYRLVIDSLTAGQTQVSLERDTTGTGSSYSTLISSFNAATATGQAAVPSNFYFSITGSTGGSYNVHEIDNLQVCALQINGVGTQIDHIRFEHAGTASTCAASEVVVKACMDAACTSTYPGPVTVNLSPSAGWSNGSTTGPTQVIQGSGTTLQLSNSTAGSITLSGTPTDVPLKPLSTPICTSPTSTSCSLAFVDDPWLDFKVVDPPSEPRGLISGKTSSAITISAVQKDLRTNACVPAFANVSKPVRFWSGHVDPTTGTMSMSVNGLPIAKASPGTQFTLPFDANGRTSIQVLYPDAGRMQLNAKADTGTAAPVSNDVFTVRPAGYCITSTVPNWNCTAGAACGKSVVAGDPFTVRVGAMPWNASGDLCVGNPTPNYRQAGVPLSTALVAPSGGAVSPFTVAGSALPGTISFAPADNGAIGASVTQNEVGVFQFTVAPVADSYFGLTIPPATVNTGRFYPAGFNVGGAVLTNRSDLVCAPPGSSFTYYGEPLRLSYTLTAVNRGGNRTYNYFGDFARLNLSTAGGSPAPASLGFGAQSGTTRFDPARLSAACANAGGTQCGTWPGNATSGGETTVTVDLQIPRGNAPEAERTVVFGSAPVDADDVAVLAPTYDRDLNGAADSARLGSTLLRYGRVRLQNAYGSELLALPVPATVEYFNNGAFVTNQQDSCTRVAVPASTTIVAAGLETLYCAGNAGFYATGARNQLSAGETVPTLRGVAPGGTATVNTGELGLSFSKPGQGNFGYLDVALNVPDYLKFNWNGVNQTPSNCGPAQAGDTDYNDDNPRARIRFGGNKRPAIIYMQEMFY